MAGAAFSGGLLAGLRSCFWFGSRLGLRLRLRGGWSRLVRDLLLLRELSASNVEVLRDVGEVIEEFVRCIRYARLREGPELGFLSKRFFARVVARR
jgi:hypothetical protein